MTLDDIPVFAMLKSRLSYLTDRQQVIAQNVANSDTPGYTAMDLKPFQVPGSGGLEMVTPTLTSPMHMLPPNTGATTQKPVNSPDSETTLNGNSVVLEEQMMKMTQARMDYDAAIGFYQQSLSLIQLAAKRPST
ncbi:MAG TPA: flagellar basal body protein [Caulobacteraceae bacterium]|nr:flagellar basal body protein [Caulobacteraceae bacterium]